LRSAGYVIVAVLVLTANTRLPFPYTFLHGLSFQNMFSAALAAPIGNAIVGRWLTVRTTYHTMRLGEHLDSTALTAQPSSLPELCGTIQAQALLESMKEIYGWLFLLALLCLVGLMMRYSDIRPRKVIEPTYRLIHRYIRRDIRRTNPSL